MDAAVCRILIAVLLYAGGASPAPQDAAITYVRPLPEASAPPGPSRDSRVENLPLFIGGWSNDTKPVEEELSGSQDEVSTPTYQLPSEEPTTSSETDAPSSTERVPEEAPEAPEAPVPRGAPDPSGARLPSPRFTSKLSYFNKNSASITNLLERTGKRKFRSRCRCEKIWNCPKLQITVPRCPEEYFMCCF